LQTGARLSPILPGNEEKVAFYKSRAEKNKRVFFPHTQVACFFLFFRFSFLPLKLCTSQTSLDLQLQTSIVLRCVCIPAISVFLFHSLVLFRRVLFGGVSVVLRKG
jgi:hypothetical protein